MGWTLQGEGPDAQNRPLHDREVTHITLLGSILAPVSDLGGRQELGRITVTKAGAKLEAVERPLRVLPANSDPHTTDYELLPRAEGASEAIFLRHGDVVSAQGLTGRFTCTWCEPEVQVTSSTTQRDVEVLDGVAETPEDETEDEDLDDVDKTMTAVDETQPKSQHQATPHMSNQVVVQETPTVTRTVGAPNRTIPTDLKQPALRRLPATPDSEEQYEPFSTAPNVLHEDDINQEMPDAADTGLTGDAGDESGKKPHNTRSPQVVIPRQKRPSPSSDDEESDLKPPSRFRKRTKVAEDNDTQESRLSTIGVENPPTPAVTAKNTKQKSAAVHADVETNTPSRSQRSQRSYSQRSAATSELYQGETPVVIATSNSALKENGQPTKFLRKQGGKLVESVKDSFNVLCIRDGDIPKTPKVLQAIAKGIPIVTDKWLSDSAKTGNFLSVDAYQPTAPAKEQEWNFKLQDVLGRPQTPFEGYTIYFTSALHSMYKPFTEIEQVCKAAGAKVAPKLGKKTEKVIILAMDDDKEAGKLMADGITCYSRDLLPISIFRGRLDLDSDEFKLVEIAKKETKKGRGKKN